MKNWVSALLGLFIFTSAFTTKAETIKLSNWVQDFRDTLKSDAFTIDQCESTFEKQYVQMFELDYVKVDQKDLKSKGKKIAEQAFLARLDLREKVKSWEKVQNPINNRCITDVRNVFRVLRYLEETAAVNFVQPKPYDENNVAEYLAGDAPYLQKNPKYKNLNFPADLKSGDLLVSRGNAPTSALIARLGEVDGQFSHLAVVYVDAKTKRKYVMEAHIEVGSTVRPYEQYANDHNFRVVVYRNKDAAVAEKGAKKLYDYLSNTKDKRYPNVAEYDFSMEMNDFDISKTGNTNGLFCSEIGYEAFKIGSEKQILLGKYRTEFKPKNRYLLDQLAVKVSDMFAPSDMEVEPNFELLAEWRDLSRVLENQRMDAVLTKFLAWADDYNYRLDPTVVMEVKAELAFALRRDRILAPLTKVDKKVPLNMTLDAIKVVMALDATVGELADFLREKNAEKVKEARQPLTFKEMYRLLENYRDDRVGKDTSTFKKLYHP